MREEEGMWSRSSMVERGEITWAYKKNQEWVK
jgi:hypothetical protein